MSGLILNGAFTAKWGQSSQITENTLSNSAVGFANNQLHSLHKTLEKTNKIIGKSFKKKTNQMDELCDSSVELAREMMGKAKKRKLDQEDMVQFDGACQIGISTFQFIDKSLSSTLSRGNEQKKSQFKDCRKSMEESFGIMNQGFELTESKIKAYREHKSFELRQDLKIEKAGRQAIDQQVQYSEMCKRRRLEGKQQKFQQKETTACRLQKERENKAKYELEKFEKVQKFNLKKMKTLLKHEDLRFQLEQEYSVKVIENEMKKLDIEKSKEVKIELRKIDQEIEHDKSNAMLKGKCIDSVTKIAEIIGQPVPKKFCNIL